MRPISEQAFRKKRQRISWELREKERELQTLDSFYISELNRELLDYLKDAYPSVTVSCENKHEYKLKAVLKFGRESDIYQIHVSRGFTDEQYKCVFVIGGRQLNALYADKKTDIKITISTLVKDSLRHINEHFGWAIE